MAKKILSILLVVTCTLSIFSQEKIKGNKNVTIVETLIDDFNTIRVGEKFEILLIQSDEASVEIETDENLHDVIAFSVKDGILSFNTTQKIQSKKRLNITVSFTEFLNHIEVNEDAEISTANTIKNDSIKLTINDYAKAHLNIKNKYLKLVNNNKSTFGFSSKSKLNIDSKMVNLELNENSKTEALIKCDSIKVDMYQSALVKIEGNAEHLELSTINTSDFSGKNFTNNTCIVVTQDSSDATLLVKEDVEIEASGSSKIQLYGDPKVFNKQLYRYCTTT